MLLSDNSASYIYQLYVCIEHPDPECSLLIHKSIEGLTITVKPSNIDFKKDITKNILDFHHRIGIKTEFSKSSTIHKSVIFKVPFDL